MVQTGSGQVDFHSKRWAAIRSSMVGQNHTILTVVQDMQNFARKARNGLELDFTLLTYISVCMFVII